MEKIKKYKAVLSVVVGLCVVVAGAYFYNKGKGSVAKESVKKASAHLLEGQVVRHFEGENKIVYKMEIPETATSTLGMDGALVKIIDSDAPYISMYFSYEGGRGYAAPDYINNVIASRVPGVVIRGTTTSGLYTWTVAESQMSEWHVAQVGDGQWLLVVENKKSLHDKALSALHTLTTK